MSFWLFIIPFIVMIIVQTIKLSIDFYKTKKLSSLNLLASGGFPSAHWALSSSITTVIALQDWTDSSIFWLALVISFLFWYDAMNVRFESGKHASYINDMRNELQGVLSHNKSFQLKERIGHTPWEVLGGIFFGITLSIPLYYWLYLPLISS